MRQKIVDEARSWLDTFFCHQGRIKISNDSKGACDCLGLVIGVAKSLGLKTCYGNPFCLLDYKQYSFIPDGKRLAAELDKYLTSAAAPQIGDLALISFVGQPQHLAIIGELDGNLTLIHAYSPLSKVCEHILDQKWQRRVVAFYSFSF